MGGVCTGAVTCDGCLQVRFLVPSLLDSFLFDGLFLPLVLLAPPPGPRLFPVDIWDNPVRLLCHILGSARAH
jgi:hypothetical protein